MADCLRCGCWYTQSVTFDFRSLAIFRMVLGFIVLSQSILLSRDFSAFYRVSGVFPSFVWNEGLLLILLFVVLPLSSIAFIIGLATQISGLSIFIGVIVIQAADPLILQGGDVLLRLLLFWSLFLPLSRVWSLDVLLGKTREPSLPLTRASATWAYTFQVCFVYWFAALLKTDPVWTQNGNALFYALNLEHFTTSLGLYLRQFPHLLQAISLITPWFELAGPCLLFVPFHREACRLAAVTLFVCFHLIGMEAIFRIGLFPLVCATAWIAFIPGFFWNCWERKNGETRSKQAKKMSEKGGSKVPAAQSVLDYLGFVLVVVSFMDVMAWNFASIEGETSERFMRRNDIYAHVLRLDQKWNMYAPAPRKEHGWLIIPADFADGTQIDLFTGQPVSWDKPDNIGDYLGNDRWKRYLSNLFDYQDPQVMQQYVNYLVNQWNGRHSKARQVQAVTVIYMKQVIQADLTVSDPDKDILYFRNY